MKHSVAVVIPNWNGEQFIHSCIESLLEQTIKAEIIVVDNGSTDRSVELITKKFPNVTLLSFPDNAGFAGGVNRGIRHALDKKHAYIALLNNDAIARKDWLQALVHAAKKHPKAAIVTGKLMRADKVHIDSTGEFLTIYGIPFSRGRNEKDSGQYDAPGQVFGASGGASLYRASLFSKVGFFDEDFFAYFEDVDISFRARLAGQEVWYEPSAIAYHRIGATSSKLGSFARYHSIKNVMLLYDRNMPGYLFWKYKLHLLYQIARMKVGALRDGEFSIFIKSFSRTMILAPKTLIIRSKTKRQRSVTIKDIDALLVHSRPPKPPTLRGVKP